MEWFIHTLIVLFLSPVTRRYFPSGGGKFYLIFLKILFSLLRPFPCSTPCLVAVGFYWSLFIAVFLALSAVDCFF